MNVRLKWMSISTLTMLALLLTACCELFNIPPKAIVIPYPPSPIYAPCTIEFDGTNSFDVDGEITRYYWNFGDGTTTDNRATVTHTYGDDGDYTATLTVTDNCGSTGKAPVTIHCLNPPPDAEFDYRPRSPRVGERVTFDASPSYDRASLIKPEKFITSYNWNFGDGSSGRGKIVTHIYSNPGTYFVRLEVTDDDGASDARTKPVSVSSR